MSQAKIRAAAGMASVLVAVAVTTPVQADNPPEAGLLSPVGFAAAVTRASLSYARMFADVRYDHLQVDGSRNALTIRDLRLAGLGPYQECKIEIGRFQLSGLSFWGEENPRMRLDAGDIQVATNCLGSNAAMVGIVTGGPMIEIADLSVSSRQSFGSGKAVIDIAMVAPGLARVEASADFDYVSLAAPGLLQQMLVGDDGMAQPDGTPMPAAAAPPPGLRGTLRHAHLSVEDLGAWARLGPIITPDIANPATIDGLVTAPAGTPTGDFQVQLAAALKAFVAEPGRVTVQIRPDAPVDFDSTGWTTPDDAIALFKPQATNAPPTPPVALIANPKDQSHPRTLGLALAAGQGVPQDRNYAIELLEPLAGDAEVDLALAELLAETDPMQAYGFATSAASQKASGAIAAVERLEASLPTADLVMMQYPADYPVADDVFATPVAVRDQALAYERGDGVPRSYALAWRLASLAAAAGDSPAQALMDRLTARFGQDPAWAKARDSAAAQAIADWSTHDLANTWR